MDDILNRRLAAYAKKRKITFGEQLGAGFHGIVRVAEDNANFGPFAVKIHRYVNAYTREKNAYLRLRENDVLTICGLNVPQLLGWDDEILAIEMSIVARPFVLDFAATWLDEAPDFHEDAWQEELEMLEKFEDRWPEVQRVLATLRSYGLFMFDISPVNIALDK